VLKVQEVIRYQGMTRVPLAPAMIQGLINLRGQIVTAIDLRRRLELAPREADQLPMNVVVRGDDGAVSLLVDEIGDVVEIQEDIYERPPETLKGVARELVQGCTNSRSGCSWSSTPKRPSTSPAPRTAPPEKGQ